ncbi:MAG: alpha/beta hydrolase [Bosea sp.]|jgi:pimeloyl-ACP methyl ester carboxylesterase|nr:alpha/beta hydrolase [Bosea sp. (in: a-proteobacteria)]
MPLMSSLGLVGLVAAGNWAATWRVAAAAEARHPPQGRFVTVPGGRMHLMDTGEPWPGAPVIVLIHGASSLHADLLSVLGPRLKAQARVIAIDRPGHGWSDRLGGREMASAALQADAIVAALAAAGARRFTIIGHSLAGAVSTRIALEHPDRVVALILLAAVTHPWPGRAITWYYHPASHPLTGGAFARLLAIPVGTAGLEGAISGVFAPQAPPPDYAQTAQIRLVLRPAAFEANAQDVAATYDFVAAQAARYGELAMPVLAIAGDADTIVWTDIHTRGIAREAQRGRAIVLPGLGHMPHHIVPELIVREALALAGA